jgi:hypothetical protein
MSSDSTPVVAVIDNFFFPPLGRRSFLIFSTFSLNGLTGFSLTIFSLTGRAAFSLLTFVAATGADAYSSIESGSAGVS